MMQFTAKQNTACSDASSCAPATCCAASACTADSAAVCKDTAILAVSFSISILVLVSICICVFSIIGLLVLLVLAWGLVNGMLLIMMYKIKNAKSDRIWIPEAACGPDLSGHSKRFCFLQSRFLNSKTAKRTK